MKQLILNYFEKNGSFIRKNILLYLIFINIYKKFIYLFPVEKKKYLFLSNNNKFKKVLDIGCNKFQTAKTLLSINNKLSINCYDPSPLIKNNSADKRIKFYNYALSNRNANRKLLIPKYCSYYLDSLGSFNVANINLYLKKNKINNKKIMLETFIVKERKFKKKHKIDFVKIDVEGAEFDVLNSLRQSINIFKPVLLIETSMQIKMRKFLLRQNYSSYFYNCKQNFFYKKNFFTKGLDNVDFYFLHKGEDRVNIK
jgi:FkbM family methyltransferase